MATVTTKTNAAPLNKRYPNKWSHKSVLFTPMGTRMEITGPLPDYLGEFVSLAYMKDLTKAQQAQLRAVTDSMRAEVIRSSKKPKA